MQNCITAAVRLVCWIKNQQHVQTCRDLAAVIKVIITKLNYSSETEPVEFLDL